MPLDPQAKAVADAYQASVGSQPRSAQTLPALRAAALAAPRAPGPDVGSVEDRVIPGPAGPLPVRIYRPHGSGPFPVLVYFHGGGWVFGSVQGHDAFTRRLTREGNCAVASVDYRLAPEARFPAPLEDCFAATRWVADHGPSLDLDATRLAVGGDSAGGNLAAAVCIRARDGGHPSIAFALLVYPVLDCDFQTPSYVQNADGPLLTRAGMMVNWRLYLAREQDWSDPLAAPLKVPDASGLPPTLVITAEYDPLRDEGEAYAERLRRAGVPAGFVRYDGMIHGFMSFADRIDGAAEAFHEAGRALRIALGTRAGLPAATRRAAPR